MVAFSYRSSVHSVTGYSPFELVFGRKPREPVHLIADEGINSYTKSAVDRMRQIALTRINVEKLTRVDEVTGDRGPYEPGDLVMVKGHSGGKFKAKYHGPYRIVECKNPDFRIAFGTKLKWVHGENLKRFVSRLADGCDVIDFLHRYENDEPPIVTNRNDTFECDVLSLDDASNESVVVSSNESECNDLSFLNENSVDDDSESSDEEYCENSQRKRNVFDYLPAFSKFGRKIVPNRKYM